MTVSVIQAFTIHAQPQDIHQALADDGCVVIKDILTPAQVERLKQELNPHFEETANCDGNFYGHVTKRLSSLMAKSETSRHLAVHPLILGVMDEFLLKACHEYQLNLTQAIRIGPGEPRQILHSDDVLFPFEHPEYEAMINCMWAVDDFTPENGATHVVPGSHKWIKGRTAQKEDAIQAVMPRGSLLIYFASLKHGGGANTTNEPRTGLVISYSLGWLRQAENQYLAVPVSQAKTFPARLQRLMGYFVHTPNVGCVEGQDPILILQDKKIENTGFREFLPDHVQDTLQQHRDKEISRLQTGAMSVKLR